MRTSCAFEENCSFLIGDGNISEIFNMIGQLLPEASQCEYVTNEKSGHTIHPARSSVLMSHHYEVAFNLVLAATQV
ncbi:hypothetical protein GUJ93_ZPchr0003g17805 [Zizania palustris]|uniref:Uncharacterized protein n=1 Tax=Zizania palustris TaxID=103762 RepID=A0A8J5SL85_ZIZPA|nr:hypothetical protein GUJ93_ZPchr0003g17805 [Zizania palustris]